jgi:hypothetical protein
MRKRHILGLRPWLRRRRRPEVLEPKGRKKGEKRGTKNADTGECIVAGVFSNVAASYDTMNDFMSLGIHRLWKSVNCFLLTLSLFAGRSLFFSLYIHSH